MKERGEAVVQGTDMVILFDGRCARSNTEISKQLGATLKGSSMYPKRLYTSIRLMYHNQEFVQKGHPARLCRPGCVGECVGS